MRPLRLYRMEVLHANPGSTSVVWMPLERVSLSRLDASKNLWWSAPLSDSLPLATRGGGDGAAGWILGL